MSLGTERSLDAALPLPSDQDASGRSFGEEELDALRQVLESGVLTSTKGSWVQELEQRFAALYRFAHAVACASGTAEVHAAIAAIDPEPGEEIVTTPITDMGALGPILYQGAIPVFADVDPHTLNVTAATVEARLSPRTRAILVTHLFGTPCDMEPILVLAEKHGLAVIEDCAQAFLAESGGRRVGTLGDLGTFSLQQGKHITCGEGGLVLARDPSRLRRARLFVNKAWPYGEPEPDHDFLALNGRMSELQGAVAAVQLGRLEAGVRQRRTMAALLADHLAGVEGLGMPEETQGTVATYWKVLLRVDPEVVPGGVDALAAELRAAGIASAPRYIRKPAFRCRIFREQRTFGNSRYPFPLARPEALDYGAERFPGVYRGLERALVLPWNERYREPHVETLARTVLRGVARLRRGAKAP
ncbi:MAG: DegT/DnrJ/EryC1/StrS family aminotransferase [Holophagales bacterium]|nr:DegT/DnrJ/EryC1/StrS family aminotransferase [Holophagales bacterium]